MTQKSWHSRVVQAIRELGEDWEMSVVLPSEVLFSVGDGRPVGYRPDCIWTWGRTRLHMAIWEVESNPTNKAIVGDVALAAMASGPVARVYAYGHSLGRRIRKPIRYADLWDRRRPGKTIPAGYVRLPRPKSLHFRVVCSSGSWVEYLDRYIELVAERRPRPFSTWEILCANQASVTGVKQSLARNESTRKLTGA